LHEEPAGTSVTAQRQNEIAVFNTLLKYKKPLKAAAAAGALLSVLALAWFTVHAPQQGRNTQVTAMESQSALFFAIERDMAALAQDARTGAAGSIGLSADYALVQRTDGTRYYVAIGAQRPLVAELLKDKLEGGQPAVFAIGDVHPPAGPLGVAGRALSNPVWLSLLGPLLFVYLIWMMGPMRTGAGFKRTQRPDTRFDDVVGVDEAKEALSDIVAYLKSPKRFSELGAKPPKGIVLEGHYGAGKTLLARAVAGEAGVPFIALAGGDFSDMFLGVGVRRVKKLFAQARQQAPCVVFIDEIDGLGKRSGSTSAAETENNRIINSLLVELDGFSPTSGIVVLGATNNVKNLDPALIRAGRFDRTCHLGLPSVDEREQLFALYAGRVRADGSADFRQLARLSTGLSPAAIANAVNAAALLAAKEGASAVTHQHFHRVLEQELMGGPAGEGQAAMNSAERSRIAVHEAGHALIARLLDVGVVEKVSILKRGRALGVTLVTDNEDVILQSEAQWRARMAMLLGGRGAEMLVLDSLSTGASNDLERVSNMAYRMVTEFGFSKTIGPFSYAGLPERDRRVNDHPEAIAEARQIVKDVENRCAALLLEHRIALEGLTAALLEHETVSGSVVDECLGAAASAEQGAVSLAA
jgi:cell division protease FtsH